MRVGEDALTCVEVEKLDGISVRTLVVGHHFTVTVSLTGREKFVHLC